MAGWQLIAIGFFNFVPVFTLTPRFIVSVRVLHARELRGQCEPGYTSTVSGSTSVPGSRGRAVSSSASIMFAGLRDEDEFEYGEEISM